jgi:two-component system cell cycle response regulator
MVARVLVVDDVDANVRLLEAKLTIEYYEVLTASDGPTAIRVAAEQKPDIILLDVMMPGMDGFETCRRIKADPATSHIPVVLVTALDGREDRIVGLDAGADDFVTKPIDDVLLFARVKSLTRLKLIMDELREREESSRRLGVSVDKAGKLKGSGGRILIVDDNARQAAKMVEVLSKEHRPVVESDPTAGLAAARGLNDLLIVNVAASEFDGLRLVAQVRSTESTRHLPILAVVDPADRPRLVKALDLGVTDLLTKPVDPVTDALTGLHNRRYMAGQLQAFVSRAALGGEPVSVLVLDIDHFKAVNDGFGHDAGDEVLREFAVRLATNVRAVDLPCRLGGEEFVVVMPGTDMEDARRIAERIRRDVGSTPFRVMGGRELLTVTISIGVAACAGPGDTPESLLKRADEGVYVAKAAGRDRVVARAA